MQAQELMTRPVVTCHVNDSLDVAAKLMWEHDCGVIPVVRDDGRLAGMITDRDICMAAHLQRLPLDQIDVSAVMSRWVLCARGEQPLTEIQALMVEHQVRRIPIVSDDGRPLGIISLSDLAIEATQPDTRMRHGLAQVAHTLAAVAGPHRIRRRAA